MHTKDMLADALVAVGLVEMADKARTGYYHDFLSPLDLPEMQLVQDLADAAKARPLSANAILELRQRVINGDFDANNEESEAWAQSEEGQQAFGMLRNKP
jgi:hypothetical protein